MQQMLSYREISIDAITSNPCKTANYLISGQPISVLSSRNFGLFFRSLALIMESGTLGNRRA